MRPSIPDTPASPSIPDDASGRAADARAHQPDQPAVTARGAEALETEETEASREHASLLPADLQDPRTPMQAAAVLRRLGEEIQRFRLLQDFLPAIGALEHQFAQAGRWAEVDAVVASRGATTTQADLTAAVKALNTRGASLTDYLAFYEAQGRTSAAYEALERDAVLPTMSEAFVDRITDEGRLVSRLAWCLEQRATLGTVADHCWRRLAEHYPSWPVAMVVRQARSALLAALRRGAWTTTDAFPRWLVAEFAHEAQVTELAPHGPARGNQAASLTEFFEFVPGLNPDDISRIQERRFGTGLLVEAALMNPAATLAHWEVALRHRAEHFRKFVARFLRRLNEPAVADVLWSFVEREAWRGAEGMFDQRVQTVERAVQRMTGPHWVRGLLALSAMNRHFAKMHLDKVLRDPQRLARLALTPALLTDLAMSDDPELRAAVPTLAPHIASAPAPAGPAASPSAVPGPTTTTPRRQSP